MKRIGILMACGVLAFGLTACDDDNGDGIMLMDSGTGGDDAGPEPMPDAGPAPMPDAGPEPMPDSGPSTCGTIDGTGFPPLPDGCVPRCAGSTADQINACSGAGSNEEIATCQRAAVEADTTPPALVGVTGGEPQEVDCVGCWDWGIMHCITASCGAEVEACLTCGDGCNPGTAGCEDEEAALDACQAANISAIQGCFNTQASRCFGF